VETVHLTECLCCGKVNFTRNFRCVSYCSWISVENEDYSRNTEHTNWSTSITSKLLPRIQRNKWL